MRVDESQQESSCREFLRGRGSNVKKGLYELGGVYWSKDWIHYYFCKKSLIVIKPTFI